MGAPVQIAIFRMTVVVPDLQDGSSPGEFEIRGMRDDRAMMDLYVFPIRAPLAMNTCEWIRVPSAISTVTDSNDGI